jgi:hypothetical protein
MDILEKYLPSIEHLEIPFILQAGADRSLVQEQFAVQYHPAEYIRRFLTDVDRTLVF